MAKYGTFMKTEDFGSQFFMGAIVKSIGLKAYQIKFSSSEKNQPYWKPHPEYPLHFLQGLWGSAFSILIHRVIDTKDKKKKPKETMLYKIS